MPTIPLQHLRSSSALEAPPKPRAVSSPAAFLTDSPVRIRLRSPSLLPTPPQLDSRDPIAIASTSSSSSSSSSNPLTPRRITLPNIPASYQGLDAGPAPGTIVGIVFGSVLGFILLFWLIVVVVGNRANAQYVEGDDTEIVVRRDHHSSRRSRQHRTRHTRSETSESSHHPPQRHQSSRNNRTERILVTETRRTESRAPPPSQPSIVQERESINIREQSRTSRRVDGDDMVEVIEEHSEVDVDTPRRKKSGYRTVDPNQYGGGNYPQRDVDRNRSKRNR